MRFSNSHFFVIFVLGVILLYSYYYFLAEDPNNISALWGTIKGNLLSFYYVSMLLSALGFIALVVYLFNTNNLTNGQIKQLFLSMMAIVVISMLWLPISLLYLKDKNMSYRIMDLIVLFLVAASSFYCAYVLYKIKDKEHQVLKNVALGGMSYFFFHTFFLDFITWSSNVLI